MKNIEVIGQHIAIVEKKKEDFISLTDIPRYKDSKRTDYVISNWLRNRNTGEFLGIWEKINNTVFNPIEFDGVRNNMSNLICLKQDLL